MAHQEACQLFIEQEIKEGLAQGKKPYSIGKELSAWVEKLFKTSIPATTIEKRAERIKKPTNVGSSTNTQNYSQNQDNQVVEAKIIQKSHGGVREGAGPPQKYDKPKEAPKPMTMPVAEQDKSHEVLLQAWTELRAWRQKYSEYPELAAVFEFLDKNYSSKLKPGQPLQGNEAVPIASEPLKSCPSVYVEEEGEKSQVPDASNEGLPENSSFLDSSSHEIGGQSTDPGTSGKEEANQRKCDDCRKFRTKPGGPSQKGNCEMYQSLYGLTNQYSALISSLRMPLTKLAPRWESRRNWR